MDDLGTFAEAADGTMALRFERAYPRPIRVVWAALTQPERLADWLGACEVEPRVGGRFNVFLNRDAPMRVAGKVLAWEPPVLLSFTWAWPGEPDSVVRCELSPEGERATRLVFTHRGLGGHWLTKVLPGWHVYLERLGGVVAGDTPDPSHAARYAEVREHYLRDDALGERASSREAAG